MEPIQQPPEILYHYTSQEGLIGIVGTKRMRATNIFYLNDSAEYTYAIGRILEVLEEYDPERHDPFGKVNSDVKTAKRLVAGSIWNGMRGMDERLNDADAPIPTRHIYILSFTEEKDDLSQWRGYCPQGNGFCLGFDTARLTVQLKKYGLSIVRCVYDIKDQKLAIRDVLNDNISRLETALSTHRGETAAMSTLAECHDNAFHMLQQLMPTMKDEAFRNENEWRFVFSGLPNGFNAGKSMPIPYKEVPLSGSPDDYIWEMKLDEPLAILNSVVVGPTPHKQLAKASVELMLAKAGSKGHTIELSKIPYRTW